MDPTCLEHIDGVSADIGPAARSDDGEIDVRVLAVVIPAYNELQRLPGYLQQVREHCERHFLREYEVIVVDDGSSDGMWDWLQREAREWPELRTLRHPVNSGKGAAVRSGVSAARAEYVLFADADGATPISAERDLRSMLASGCDLAIGTRVGMQSEVHRHWFRSIQAWVFRCLVRVMVGLPVLDSQCGFKMLTRRAALQLFPGLKENGFLLDIELLLAAREAHCVVGEHEVDWREIEGSKVRPVRDAWRMATGLWRLRRGTGLLSAGQELIGSEQPEQRS